MANILLTGGSGFFGEIIKKRLLKLGHFVVNVDIEIDEFTAKNYIYKNVDIRNYAKLEAVYKKYNFDYVIHCAAILAHAVKDMKFLWESNVDGTRNVAELAKQYHVKKVVFTSSNCLWAKNFGRKVLETDIPDPVEIYGKSKLEGEKILMEYTKDFDSIIFRCPTIIDEGRLGLLSILFEFMDEGRKVWVVGGGENRYQFIYAQDLVDAILASFNFEGSEIFNIGSDNVKTFKEVYDYVIKKASEDSSDSDKKNMIKKAKVANLNKPLTLLAMKVAYFFKMSPLGPYQYKMIAEDFEFDTTKIKKLLKWKPTLTNEEMLYKSYNYYHKNIADIRSRKNVSAHKQPAKMGVIKLLKWIS